MEAKRYIKTGFFTISVAVITPGTITVVPLEARGNFEKGESFDDLERCGQRQ